LTSISACEHTPQYNCAVTVVISVITVITVITVVSTFVSAAVSAAVVLYRVELFLLNYYSCCTGLFLHFTSYFIFFLLDHIILHYCYKFLKQKISQKSDTQYNLVFCPSKHP